MKLIQFERKREVSRKAFGNECKVDNKLRHLRNAESGLFYLGILSLCFFISELGIVWIGVTLIIYILDFSIIFLIKKRRRRLRQPYMFL